MTVFTRLALADFWEVGEYGVCLCFFRGLSARPLVLFG